MIKAVLFDMDGVISDTQHIHAEVETKLLKDYGVDLSAEEITAKYAGYSDDEFYEVVFADYGITKVTMDEAIEEVWKRKFAASRGNILPLPGVQNLISDLKENGFKLAVASASIMEFIELVLSDLNLSDKFDAITSAIEVENGKPAPDIFLLVAKKIGVEPKNCVVIEDSVNGMIAAKKAGMKCIGIVKEKGDYPADLVITSFDELSIEKIRAL